MKKVRCLLCMGLAILFMAAFFRPGYRIICDGKALPGIYEPELTLRCSSAAIRAAEEITRSYEAPPYTLVPVLCRSHTQVDERKLRNTLLDAYDGVVKLYAVSAGDVPIGTVSNLAELYRMKRECVPAWASAQQLTVREVYTYPEAETPSEEIRTAFLQLHTAAEPM